MRSILGSSLLALVVSLGGTACDGDNGTNSGGNTERITGSGNVVQVTRAVSGVQALTQSSIGSVTITLGENEELRIIAEDSLLDHIITEMQSGTLIIRTEAGIELDPTEPIEYHLTARRMKNVFLAGVGDITASDINEDEISVMLTGVGNVTLEDIDTDLFDVLLLGVGDVTATGSAVEQTVSLIGIGDYLARDLESAACTVELVGVGDATVKVSDELIVTLTGVGNVFYLGSPDIQSTITGQGSVQRL